MSENKHQDLRDRTKQFREVDLGFDIASDDHRRAVGTLRFCLADSNVCAAADGERRDVVSDDRAGEERAQGSVTKLCREVPNRWKLGVEDDSPGERSRERPDE